MVQLVSHILTLETVGTCCLEEVLALRHALASNGTYYELVVRCLSSISKLILHVPLILLQVDVLYTLAEGLAG